MSACTAQYVVGQMFGGITTVVTSLKDGRCGIFINIPCVKHHRSLESVQSIHQKFLGGKKSCDHGHVCVWAVAFVRAADLTYSLRETHVHVELLTSSP